MHNLKNSFLETNLLSLSSGNAQLAEQLSYAEESDSLSIAESKKGKLIPLIVKNMRQIPLHSRFDPEKEGNRFFNTFNNSGYIVFLGFGAAYHINPFLANKQISEILIIDKDIGIFKKIIHYFNLTGIFLDKRVKILIDPEPEIITSFILKHYIPAISGNLHILKLRSRVETEPDFFSQVTRTINNVIAPLSEDFSVQSYFGKRWFINTLNNLEAAEKATTTIPPVQTALVIGAGPSLEVQMPEIKQLMPDSFIISTDTALPALLKFNIKPNLVISIDCQHITYFHFLEGLPQGIPLVIDLASPRNMTKLTENILFFTSGHPFSLYVKNKWRSFPFIDTSGGNVSHAAVSLAYSLGAKHIHLFGVDFSYPRGKSYARGTYLYPYFCSRSNRFSPLENYFITFLFHNDQIDKKYDPSGIRYVTKPMISYKTRLESLISDLDTEVIPSKGEGEKIYCKNNHKEKTMKRFPSILSAGPADTSWKLFLHRYDRILSTLPIPKYSVSEYMNSLTPLQKEICTTILPAAAAIRKDAPQGMTGTQILKETIEWTRNVMKRYIS